MNTRPPNLAQAAALSQSRFGVLLRQHRLVAGLSQEVLAERAGISVQAVSLLENGRRQAPYRYTVSQLARALGLSEAETTDLEAAVVRGRHSTGSAPTTATVQFEHERGVVSSGVHSPDAIPNNLPRQLTTFVGREREIAELRALLTSTRLLTLTGAGGCGKTRLALEVAGGLSSLYPDGVWVVDLAPLTDPALVVPTIAQALSIRQDGERPLDAILVDALRARRLLLVLDNCEHLIEVCATAAERLLQECPLLHMLATSREALRILGETAWRVPSLTLPDSQSTLSFKTVTRSEAVRLFTERATAAEPHFMLTQVNVQAVADICRELDGMPLALELAAARVRILTVGELAARLDQRFQLLTGGSRTALPRHQALQATVDWSYDLLAPEEQRFFCRLSVFAGGWTLEAAESVGIGESITVQAAPDLLMRLVEKSLVVAEALDDGTSRYRLLETLRQYGRARLEASGELTPLHQRHATYYLSLAERIEPELTGAAQLRWLDQLECEHDNLRAALTWWLARAEHEVRDEATLAAEAGLRLAGALFWFWFLHDHHSEAVAWLDQALAQGTAVSETVRAKAFFGAGIFAWSLNDLARSEALLTQSVDLSRAVGDRRGYVLALGSLGFTLCQNGQDERGGAVVEESIAVAREVAEPWLLAYALLHRLLRVAYGPAIARADERAHARVAGAEARQHFQAVGDGLCIAEIELCLGELAMHEGDFERAKAALRAALPMMRAVGWRTSIADGLARLGDVARNQGDIADATSLYQEALTLYRQSGRRLGANLIPHVPAILCHLADMALERGDWTAAQILVGESLSIVRDTPATGGPLLPEALEVRAALSAAQDAPHQAIRLAGAAAALRAQLDRPLAASEQATLERRLLPARQMLSAGEQAEAWAEGRGMTPEQAIACAMQEPLVGPAAPSAVPCAPAMPPS